MDEFESVSVHLFDGSDANFAKLYGTDNGRSVNFMTTYKKLVAFGTRPSDVCNWIKQQIGPNKIHILRIVAHGDSGAFFLGQVYQKNSFIDWQPLKGHFDPAARIEIHSCAVASDIPLHNNMLQPGQTPKRGTFSGNSNGQGVQFMQAFAKAVNAKVIASIDDAYVNSSRWSLSNTGINNPVTVLPDGTIQTQALNPMVPD